MKLENAPTFCLIKDGIRWEIFVQKDGWLAEAAHLAHGLSIWAPTYDKICVSVQEMSEMYKKSKVQI